MQIMNRQDHDRFKIQLIRDQAKKKKVAPRELALIESTQSLKKGDVKFKSMHQQYKNNLEETQDKKFAMHVALDDETGSYQLFKTGSYQLFSRATAERGGASQKKKGSVPVQFEAATKTIDRAREEYEEYKSGMLKKSRDSQDPGRDREMANPSSSINCLSSRSMVGESTSFK
jgi:hypothetical protein